MGFPFYMQHDGMDCGPTCLRVIAKYYGKTYRLETLRSKTNLSRDGVSLRGISEAAESIGFRALGVKVSFDKLAHQAPLPCIIHWRQSHFVVLYAIKRRKPLLRKESVTVSIADPSKGLVQYDMKEFVVQWNGNKQASDESGFALLLEPTPRFFSNENEEENRLGWQLLFQYLSQHKKLILQLVLGLSIGSIVQLIFPFLTQAIVDVGIRLQSMPFIYLILFAQLMLFAGRTSVEFIRSWILLYISARVNVSILSDFLVKLMRLPISFFDTKILGDIIQRVSDHQRIETFLTNQSLTTLFSLVNLVLFGVVLSILHWPIFIIFLVSSAFYAFWVIRFFRKRRILDFKRFDVSARSQGALIQLVNGMQEIKLNNCETSKRWDWERIQAQLFHYNVKNLSLNQYQQAGAFFINEGKNILITFLAAKAVIDGNLTLGGMLSVQYIIGQLNSPIEQMIYFLQMGQDAKISLDRLNEVHQMADEEPPGTKLVTNVPRNKSIHLRNVAFKYPGDFDRIVLNEINLSIPAGKTTAIVGMSGSGKTTLLKLLLRFYNPTSGEIFLGETRLDAIAQKAWRQQCGVVMQDGFIFPDTIARNIAISDEEPDLEKLLNAAQVACIQGFIESLPLGYNTRIGANGNGLSQGQKQRILIARAVYKDPQFIFFDEATNALDTENEKHIMRNLEIFFKGRTVVVVAHRLSTVKNADQIVVLDNGHITEQGSHFHLTTLKKDYFRLIKNQLELGN